MSASQRTIALGSDHRGFDVIDELRAHLESAGWTVIEPPRPEEEGASVDYPDAAAEVAAAVRDGMAERGVLVCGSGIGMSIAANKVHGVRAALACDATGAEMSRRHNDANVLCMGSSVIDTAAMASLIDLWLDTPFEGGRHARRVDKIAGLESVSEASS